MIIHWLSGVPCSDCADRQYRGDDLAAAGKKTVSCFFFVVVGTDLSHGVVFAIRVLVFVKYPNVFRFFSCSCVQVGGSCVVSYRVKLSFVFP